MFKFLYTPPVGASTEYQISNREFSDYLQTYYCDFLSNVYRQARLFSVVIMGNVTHILPVLHCLKRGIAFISSFYYRQDLPQAALPVFRLLTGRFGVFRPAAATRCTDQG